MGSSSGLLCLGIVLLWAFVAVPHWVVRRECVASAAAADAQADEVHLLARRAEREEHAHAGVRLLTRTVGSSAAGPSRAGASPGAAAGSVAVKGSAAKGPEAGGVVAALGLVCLFGLVAVGPMLLAALGQVPLALAPAGLVVAFASVLVMRARARSRARRAAQERALAVGRARVRAAQARAGARRTAADLAAEAGARAAAREAALARSARVGVRARAVGE